MASNLNKIGPALQFLRFDDKQLLSPDYSLPIKISSYDDVYKLFEENSNYKYNLHKVASSIPIANGIKLNDNNTPEIIYNNILPGQPVFIPFNVNNENDNGKPTDWAIAVGTINTSALNSDSSVALFPSFKTINNIVDEKLIDYRLSLDKLADGLWMGNENKNSGKLAVNLANDPSTNVLLYFKPTKNTDGSTDNIHTQLGALPLNLGGYLGTFEDMPIDIKDLIKNTDKQYPDTNPPIYIPKYGTLKEGGDPKNKNDYHFNMVSIVTWLYDVLRGGLGLINGFNSNPGLFVFNLGEPYGIDIWTKDIIDGSVYNSYGIKAIPYPDDVDQTPRGLFLCVKDKGNVTNGLHLDSNGLYASLMDIGLGKIVTDISNQNNNIFNISRNEYTTDPEINNSSSKINITLNISENNNNRLVFNSGLYVSNISDYLKNINNDYTGKDVKIRVSTENNFNPSNISDNAQVTFIYE